MCYGKYVTSIILAYDPYSCKVCYATVNLHVCLLKGQHRGVLKAFHNKSDTIFIAFYPKKSPFNMLNDCRLYKASNMWYN